MPARRSPSARAWRPRQPRLGWLGSVRSSLVLLRLGVESGVAEGVGARGSRRAGLEHDVRPVSRGGALERAPDIVGGGEDDACGLQRANDIFHGLDARAAGDLNVRSSAVATARHDGGQVGGYTVEVDPM